MNTLRNQMIIGFVGVMAVVLVIFGLHTYRSVSGLLKTSAAKHIQQTAVQANGRLEALIAQLDTITLQIMTDRDVQELLLKERRGIPPTFGERQSLASTMGRYLPYTSGISRVELYTMDYKRLFPLDETSLLQRVKEEQVHLSEEQRGRLLWLGEDPKEPGQILALRRISLVDRWFSTGGYMLVSMDRRLFELVDNQGLNQNAASSEELLLLLDQQGRAITGEELPHAARELLQHRQVDSGTNAYLEVDGKEYMVVRQYSEPTGWSLLILTPVKEVTRGISVLQSAIALSACIGFILLLILSYVVSHLITRPILHLIKSMRGARDGVLKPSSTYSRTMELQELTHTYNQMVNHLNELIQLVYEKELLQSQTELKALQAQINPHFLYNTLEAFYWSLVEHDEEELAELVIAMSHIFRYVISSPEQQEWVTLREELEHIERYLQLMKMRLGARLEWKLVCPEAATSVPVPKLLLQPLVENAIVHGIEDRLEGGEVAIVVYWGEESNLLTVRIEDNGNGMKSHILEALLAEPGTPSSTLANPLPPISGVGLRNVKRRLELFYGQQGVNLLQIESGVGQGTRLLVHIPIREGGSRSCESAS